MRGWCIHAAYFKSILRETIYGDIPLVPDDPRRVLVKHQIEQALKPLVGLRLWGPARVLHRLLIQCGEPGPAPTRLDPTREVGEFAIYVSCAWRLIHGDRLVVGSTDCYWPSDLDHDMKVFDWKQVGVTWWDKCMETFFQERAATLPRIEAVSADVFGGFRLSCSEEVVLEVFPNFTCAEFPWNKKERVRFWRLLSRWTLGPEFVVGTSGVLTRPPRGNVKPLS